MKKIIMFVMVLAIGLTAGIAKAALLASESFEYTADALLKDQNGGTGWAGPWGPWEEWQDGTGATIGAGSLEPPGVVGTGNHVEVVDDSLNPEDGLERDLTTPLTDDGSTYWISVVFQKSNDDNSDSWCGFVLGNIWYGKGYGMDDFLLMAEGGEEIETGVPVTDLSWLVLKIETNPGAEEQVYLWVNPDAGAEPSTFTANANIEMALSGADSFVLEYGGSGANSGDFKCDEIKIGTSFDDIVYYGGPKNPIAVDPNVMTVYEEGTTEGDFEVSLKFPPMGQGSPGNPEITPISMEIIVDPNGFDGGGNDDLTLIGGSGPDNRITFTRTTANWNVPEVIRFEAIDDSIAEPPNLYEVQNIAVWAVPTPHEPNLARPVAQKIVIPAVIDNDQADILFTYSLPEKTPPFASVTGPVQVWEEPRLKYGSEYLRWINIGITLQVPPSGGPVKLNAGVSGEIEGDNLPHTKVSKSTGDPCSLPYLTTDDPNGLIFTAANYNVSQSIRIWGFDDDVLQIEEAYGAGDQNYQATLSVWVVDGGGDERYQWTVLGDPCEPGSVDETFSLEREVQIDIEDDECGAWGIMALDIGNPNAFTDPNYRDSDGNPLPDCFVDIYDMIELATKWLNCSYLQDPSCESYL